MSDSIKLSREGVEGVEAVVKVGDKVPMTDGSNAKIVYLENSILPVTVITNGGERISFGYSGRQRRNFSDQFVAIDIAKLAEQQAALARPAAVPAEALLELAARWEADAKAAERHGDEAMSPELSIGSLAAMATYSKCRRGLLRLIPGAAAGKEGGDD